MKKIDLNCDMGESFGAWTMGLDAEAIRHVTSANIACGFHAGDPHVMHRTVMLAKDNGVGVGAHPGYPDLMGFGRRNMDCNPEEIRDYIIYQVGAMKGFCAALGVPIQHVKPHGSLYNTSVGNEVLIRAITGAIAAVDRSLIYLALGGAQAPLVKRIAKEAGIRVAFEAFPDRAYTPDGRLASRQIAGAVIEDSKIATERALRMAKEGRIIATDGSVLEMEIHTLCVHGDNPSAVEHVKEIRATLEGAGMQVVPMGTFI
ncbi:MAG TPA: 5-oxoprolinase subunit PxpA [Syntrophales bacterium]|nr:5-oxoprolinase subunit PxpA [Syntrophales bacterium]HPI57737.1 5-oxoprolinase subunit PxpA [Syntrophales bacterium]HPN25853.1 5-oxoprolinase subunit PxpA [Syntrophales bacterium]HQM30373.1 5-oxoprolinase subunit PxpA [Syntrophales bacterium]